MTLLTNFADYYSYTSTSYSDNNSTASAGAALVFVLVAIVLALVVYALVAFLLSTIFKKAGVKQWWAAWVPVYGEWKLLQLGGQWGGWAVIALIPYVNIISVIFLFIAQYRVSKGFGKGDAFVLWAIFIPIVWYIWLAVDSSKWQPARIDGSNGDTTKAN